MIDPYNRPVLGDDRPQIRTPVAIGSLGDTWSGQQAGTPVSGLISAFGFATLGVYRVFRGRLADDARMLAIVLTSWQTDILSGRLARKAEG